MTTRPFLNVGDEITNWEDYPVVVTGVEVVHYGLLIHGVFDDEASYRSFAPFEMPAPDRQVVPWYNWDGKNWLVLPGGRKLALVCLRRSNPMPRTIEAYDAQMEKTWEIINKEQGRGNSYAARH